MLIKEYRKQLHISQFQLANLLDVKRSTVSMWETGKSCPRANNLDKIAKVLHCSVNDLFDKNISK